MDRVSPPHRVSHLVEASHDAVVFASGLPRADRSAAGMRAGAGFGLSLVVVAAVMSGCILAIAPGSVPAVLGWLVAVATVVMAAVSSVVVSDAVDADRTSIEASSTGLRECGLAGQKLPRSGRIVLRGKPGSPFELASANQQVALLPASTGPMGWDFDSALWLGERVAALLQVDLLDERDRDDWERWTHDAGYRAEMAFEEAVDQSRTDFPRLHAHPPTEPDHVPGLHGMRVFFSVGGSGRIEVDVTSTQVACRGQQYLLSEVRRVEVVFSRSSLEYSGQLVMLVGARRVTLVRLRTSQYGDRAAGQLHWLAERIREQVAKARIDDRGTAADVPEELAHIGRRRHAVEKG